jgi:hypothetical protein
LGRLFVWFSQFTLFLVSNSALLFLAQQKVMMVQRTQSVRDKKLQNRLSKLAEDEQRTDGTAIRDTDLSKWIAPPVSWGYGNLIHVAVRWVLKNLVVSFIFFWYSTHISSTNTFSNLVKVKDPKMYFSLGAHHFSLELIRLFLLFLARTSSGMLDERITAKTMQSYNANTIAAAYRCTGKKQLYPEEKEQVYVYIKALERDSELSTKVRFKHVAMNNDLDLLIDAVFSDAYNINVLSIRVVLIMALYMNLFVDSCGRGSDLAWGGPMIAEQENHCLCWNHCHFYVVNMDDSDCGIAANIEIKYQKGQRNKGEQKIVTLRLLPATMAMHDSLRLLVTLALVDGVFGPGATWASLLAVDPGKLQIIFPGGENLRYQSANLSA